MTDLWLSGAFFQALNTPKTRFQPGRWGAYDAPPDPLVSWGGDTPSLRRLDLGASLSGPLQHKFLATPMRDISI